MNKGKRTNKKKKEIETVVNDSSVINQKIIRYLKTWESNRNQWKFEKVKQIRLVTGMLDCEKVPDDIFPIFIAYMESSKGKIRDTVISKATEVVEEMENWSALDIEAQEKLQTKPDVNKYNRARIILQSLQ
ncbi:cholesin [Lycorma delicatula]|uniref:cholesin n=1 Tax=Lycorma delicatula TaxID=130591 RepID=UPI003F50FC5B